MPMNEPTLRAVRDDALAYLESIRDKDGPYGCYRRGPGRRPDLYCSIDAALMRAMMGEDLALLPEQQRREWIDHINSYQNPADGRYTDTWNHAPLHANGLAIGALAFLKGTQQHRVSLYDPFADEKKVVPWLENLDWRRIWSQSHLFWGGVIHFSFSRRCKPAFRDAVAGWLTENLDEATGWWRKGAGWTDERQPLGGAAHIWPFFQHHNLPFPYPERVIDSVLALQKPSGRWMNQPDDEPAGYYEYDALYALEYMRSMAPGHRSDDIGAACGRFADFLSGRYQAHVSAFPKMHPHSIRPIIGCFSFLQRLCPDRFHDVVAWTDVFTNPLVYRTDLVEKQGVAHESKSRV